MNKQKRVALVAVGVAAGLSLAAAGYASAATATTTSDLPPMVEGLAEKFNLNKTEVAAYLETERETRQAEREAEFTKSLETLVSEGKLTEAQKTAILSKHEELQTKREALRDTTGSDKRDQMDTIRDEWTSFLKDLGVDESLMPHLGPGAGMGPEDGRGMGRGMHQNQ